MDAETITNRVRAIQAQLRKKQLAYLIATKTANVTYATGFLGDDSWALITPKAVYLVTDSRYTEQAKKECPVCKIIERKGQMAQAVAKLLKKLKSAKGLAVEKSTSIAAFEGLKKSVKPVRLKTAANIIESVRSIKDPGEIAAVKTAAQIARKALKQTRKFIRQGITENELAGRLDLQIRRLGATTSFETIVAFGANAALPHYKPHSKKLKKNDTVLIDFGARYKGYCCDITRCYAVGRPSNLYKKVYETVQKAQATAIGMIKDHADIQQVDAATRAVIAKSKLPVYGHGTGHGLGLEVHEDPIVSRETKGKLKAGQIITIEPSVYMPGKLGVRIEDDILVTKTGYEILTR